MNLTKKIKKPTYIIKVVSFLFLFSFGANTKIICQNYVFWDLVYSADSAFEKKSYLLAFKKYNICFKMDKRNCHFFENFAYSAVLSGDTKKCISIIKYGIKKYEIDPYHLTKDTTIKSILELKSSSFLKNRIIKLSKYQNDSLRDKLIEIYNSDQKIAIDYKMTNEERKKKNLQNMLSIVEILDSHNWLNKRVVGIRANMTFFLVLQHSTLDYQIKYLDMMRKAVKEGNAESYHLALLEDRIALKNGKRQIYGTQIGFEEMTGKPYVPFLVNPEEIDKRRLSVGLTPLKYYLKRWNIDWNLKLHQQEAILKDQKWVQEKKYLTFYD